MANVVIAPEQFKKVLPARMQKNVSQELMDQINTTISDPVLLESFKENLLGLSTVLAQGKFKMSSYICAVKFVSYRLVGTSITDSYLNTFPGKHRDFVKRNIPAKTVSSYASAYNKTKLVWLLLEQTMVPTHILNAPLFQRAINIQAQIMVDQDASFKVRSDAANSLLTHLKPPESQKLELDIGIKDEGGVIGQLREATAGLAEQMRREIAGGGTSARDAAAAPLALDITSPDDEDIIDV